MSSEVFVAAAILGSSFWGSWHCAAMCGPVAGLMAQKRSLWIYHLGRGFSYILLGAIGGYLGSFLMASDVYTLRLVSGVVFAAILILLGVQTFRGQKAAFSPQSKWLHSIYNAKLPAVFLGVLSVFLPCGWLYSYILAAAATQSVLYGSATMALFWLAGLPALSSVSILTRQSIRWTPQKKQFIAGTVLVLAGLYSLANFYLNHSHCM